MKPRLHISLLAKALVWLMLHLLILVLAFAGFVRWQLGMGLDSLLSGAAGERLRIFGESVSDEMGQLPPAQWNAAIKPLADSKNVQAAIFDPAFPDDFPLKLPANVRQRALAALPPPQEAGAGERRGAPPWARRLGQNLGLGPPQGRGPLGGMGPPDGFGPPAGDSADERPLPADESSVNPQPLRTPAPRPIFLVRGDASDGYWAGISLVMPVGGGPPNRQHLLLIRADRLDGSGMFFELKPWLWGGLAVLGLSLAFWTPFMLGITRYLHRLTLATDGIAAGHFDVALPRRGQDELAQLGQAIQSMAARLDQLITGQKRFLGDAAHELCAPLARLRTGLGILEMKLGDAAQSDLASIDSEAAELATLVEEILAFSRAKNRAVRAETFSLAQLVEVVAAREANGFSLVTEIPPELSITADSMLFGRALGNILRNAGVHAGPSANVRIAATQSHQGVTVTITDDGPGVAAEELPKLFEPFYRPDRSRSRETGGSGLGLAIVRTAIEACNGTTRAFLPPNGGFGIAIELPNP
jgi:two-component system sensor histidine kinase CpxA